MIESLSPYLIQYGVLGVWTATLLWERKKQVDIAKSERKEHISVIKEVSNNMALVNQSLQSMAQTVNQCHRSK